MQQLTADRASAYVARLATNWSARFGDQRIVRLHGTLASVDLSGFTRLSERLVLNDSGGAEELNAAINSQFIPLIEIAHGLGGDILQFGGDALLIWFEGAEHATRACAAAWNMQRCIVEHGRVETPLGPVRLRMSVGVATGVFTFAVIGRTHRELLVLGSEATRTVDLESRANAGEILVSDATAGELPQQSIRSVGDGAWKIRRSIESAAFTLDPPAAGVASSFLPPEMRPIVEADIVTAEHRRVTVAFVKVPGTDVLAEVGHEADAIEVLDRVADAADAAVEQFGVCWSATDVGPDGFKLLFFAGAPVAQEDDAGRVLRTAGLFVERCADLGLNIGVNTGRAFAANVGHPDRRTFAIIGDTVNLAARLMGKSQPSRPLTVEASVSSSRVGWNCGPTQLYTMKGKRHPVPAFELLGETEQLDRSAITLVGRDVEMALLQALRPSRGSVGTSVEVVGEAGTGKTLLVENFLSLIAGASASDDSGHLFATATPFRSHTAYGALAPYFASLASEAGDGTSHLDADDLVARRDRHHAEVVASLVDNPSPTTLVVEDIQWLDEASVAFLALLVTVTDRLPWRIILTRRPDVEALPTEHRVDLGGLPLEDLLTAYSPPPGSGWLDADLQRLHRAVGGNPMLFAEGLQLPPHSTGEIAVGRGVELLAQRLDQLAPTTRRVARVLAVAGRPLSPEMLALLAERSDLTDELSGELGGLLRVSEGLYWFAGEPLVAVAYSGMARRDRRQVHAQAAVEFEMRADELRVSPAELAKHYFHGGAVGQTIRWSRAAAEQARTAGSLRDAAGLLGWALEAASRERAGGAEDGLAAELAELDIALGRFDHADQILRRSGEHRVGGPTPRNVVLRARAAQQAGRLVSARRFLRRVLSSADATAADHADALLLDGLVLYHMGRTRASAAMSWQGLLAAKRMGDDRRRAQAHLQLEMARWASGHVDAARHQNVAEQLFRRVHDRKGLGFLLMNRGVNRMNEGPWSLALADCRESSEVLDEAGYLIDGAIAAMNGCVILVRQGHGDLARRHADKIARTFRGLGWPEGIAYLHLPLAAEDGQRGDIASALDRLADAEKVFVRTNNFEFLGETRRQRAICLLHQRRPDEATEALAGIDPAWFELDPALAVAVSWLGGHAALQRGELDAAGELLHRAEQLALSSRLPYDRARVAWSLEAWSDATRSSEREHWRSLREQIFHDLEVTESVPPLPA